MFLFNDCIIYGFNVKDELLKEQIIIKFSNLNNNFLQFKEDKKNLNFKINDI